MARDYSSRVRSLAISFIAFCFAGVLLWASPVHAQPTKDDLAHKHFESGAAYLQQSDYESALREFQSAYRLSPRPEILLNIATVHERRGQLSEAVETLNRYLEVEPGGEHSETVKVRIQNLQQRIDAASAEPTLAPTPPPPPPSAPVEEQPAPPEPAPAPASAAPDHLPAYLVLAGAGVAALGATVTGIVANSEYTDLEGSCEPNCTDEEVSRGKSLALTSTILTAVAVVGAGVGIALFVAADSQTESPSARLAPRLAVGADPQGVSASARWTF